MEDRVLWKLNTEAWRMLESRYEPAIQPIMEQSGLEGRGWGLLLAALTFEPDPATPAQLMVRNPYTSADLYLARLRVCAGKGFLKESTAGEFRLTSQGRSKVELFITQARNAMAKIDPLLLQESRTLAGYYKKIVQTCLETPPPPQSWSINLSYKLMPEDEPSLPFIEQAMSCLSAYRDDAHLAAWKDTGLSATALEMLTVLWREEARSFEDVFQKLAFRGYADQIYEKAFDELNSSGYLQGSRGGLSLSPSGSSFREQIEEDTDRYFFSPWVCLNPLEKAAMGQYLIKLLDGLMDTSVTHG